MATSSEPTFIGCVRQVLGARVTVAIDPELAGVAPIYQGHLQPIGQIGSLVRIPQGPVDLIAQVSLLGIGESRGTDGGVQGLVGERWLEVHLLGEVARGTGEFRRGVSLYPGLDDEVHFATPDNLRAVFRPGGDGRIPVGTLAAAEDVPVSLDADLLVTRHSAVVGSTGSGKSSFVANILQQFAGGEWPSALIVVIDPHGEYGPALKGRAAVRSVLGSDDQALRVPFWALPADDIMVAFTGSTGGPTTRTNFSSLVAEERKRFAADASWLTLDASAITADTPVPFDIKQVWYALDSENRETRTSKGDPTTAAVVDPGDATKLLPATFEPYEPGGASPFQAPTYGVHSGWPERLRRGLVDPQLAFLQPDAVDPDADHDPLLEALEEWFGGDESISLLDFGGVPARASDLAIGVILNLILEVALRTPPEGPGVGRPRPVLIVLEEAHRYLSEAAVATASAAVNRVAREGRKYGIGLMLVTQRPSELPDTALAQCGTIVGLRLANAHDQGALRAALPESASGLADAYPSLRTGEAVITGEAVTLPARVSLTAPLPFPDAADPPLDPWRSPSAPLDLTVALSSWRTVFE